MSTIPFPFVSSYPASFRRAFAFSTSNLYSTSPSLGYDHSEGTIGVFITTPFPSSNPFTSASLSIPYAIAVLNFTSCKILFLKLNPIYCIFEFGYFNTSIPFSFKVFASSAFIFESSAKSILPFISSALEVSSFTTLNTKFFIFGAPL